MKNALIISASDNIGHISLANAWYEICHALNYSCKLYLSEKLYDYVDNKTHILKKELIQNTKWDLAIIISPSEDNLKLIHRLRKRGTKIGYIFHEPFEHYSYFWQGNLKNRILKLGRLIFQLLTLINSNIIFLPSDKAYKIYNSRFIFKQACRNNFIFPLIFKDEKEKAITPIDKKYFSFIGSICEDHFFEGFLLLISEIIKKNLIPEVKLLIATKATLDKYENILKEIRNSNRLVIISGKVMSNEEINKYYNESFLIWNAYNRTTQSGVLVKSYMFGTPVLYLKCNQNEFYKDGYNALSIHSNTNTQEMITAINQVYTNRERYSTGARNSFEQLFNYKKFVPLLKRQLDSLL